MAANILIINVLEVPHEPLLCGKLVVHLVPLVCMLGLIVLTLETYQLHQLLIVVVLLQNQAVD